MDTRSTLPAGTLLDGTYRIESVLGSGGFGITYRAEDVSLRTSVALKEYYPADFGERESNMSVRPKSERHRSSFEWGRSSFLKEAQMLARFRHASIVRVTRVFEAHSTAYMVMDFEQGQSFETWLQQLGRPPNQGELDKIALPVLDALELMHAKNSLHRDIAPDNVIVRPDGSPVLVDFGAARHAVGEMSRSLTRIIKAGYSPSEQYAAQGSLQGPWTDLYAFGGTLYRAVAGRAPEEATLRMSDDLMPPASRVAAGSGYRRSFLAAIDACLKVRHQERPQSVAELRTLLLSPDRPSGRAAAKAAPPSERRRRPWALAASVALLLLGGTYAAFELGRPVPGAGGGTGLAKPPAVTDTQAEQAQRRREEDEQRQAAAAAAEREARRRADEQAEREAALNAARANAEIEAARVRTESEAQARREEEERVAAVRRAEEERAREEARIKKAEEERQRLAALKKAEDARKKAEDDRRREEKAAKARRRPDALGYSGEVWGRGQIPHNQVVTRQTQHGVLSCRGGNLQTGAQRECWWQ